MAHQPIDLKMLSQRESETVEWKENGDDSNIAAAIAKTISAFANDIGNLGGGYVVCGAKEVKDIHGFPMVVYTGLCADKLKEVEGKVLQHCRDYISPAIAPIVHVLKNPENDSTRILVFVVIADSQAHTYRDGDSLCYYVRISKETRAARNGFYRQLMENKRQTVPFDKRPNPNTRAFDVDLTFFTNYLEEMGLLKSGREAEYYISDSEKISEFIPPILAKKPLDGDYCLHNFALLAFGKKSAIYREFTEAYVVLSIYNGTDRSAPYGTRHTITGSIIEQAKGTITLLEMHNSTIFDKESDKPNKDKYSNRAIQEAVVNAVVHRDYLMADPIRITVFTDRIEIWSPGALHWGIDKEMFKAGKSSPRWRNQTFAYLFNRLRLAQAEGQGIHTMIHSMRTEGCPDPIFEIGTDSVMVTLPANYAAKL